RTWIDELQGIANQLYEGSKLSPTILRRMCGKICQDHPALKAADANALPLSVAIKLLKRTVKKAVSQPTDDGDWISFQDAKRILECSSPTLSKKCALGLIRKDGHGRGCRVRYEDVRKLVAQMGRDREPSSGSDQAKIDKRIQAAREEKQRKTENNRFG